MAGETNADKVKRIIIDVTHSSVGSDEIDDGDFLIDDLGVDSLGMLRLVGRLEKEFGIFVPQVEVTLGNFKSVKCLCTYIESKLRAGDA